MAYRSGGCTGAASRSSCRVACARGRSRHRRSPPASICCAQAPARPWVPPAASVARVAPSQRHRTFPVRPWRRSSSWSWRRRRCQRRSIRSTRTRFGLTPLAITVVFAAYGVGVMGGLVVTGRLSDHIGRKPPLAGGLVIGLVAMALFIAAHDLGRAARRPPADRDDRRPLHGHRDGLARRPRRTTASGRRSSPSARTWEAWRWARPSEACSPSSAPTRCGRSTWSSWRSWPLASS